MELSAKTTVFVPHFFGGPWGGCVIEIHVLVSDRNIFSKKRKYMAISARAGEHVGELIFLLSAIRRSYRENAAFLFPISAPTGSWQGT